MNIRDYIFKDEWEIVFRFLFKCEKNMYKEIKQKEMTAKMKSILNIKQQKY